MILKIVLNSLPIFQIGNIYTQYPPPLIFVSFQKLSACMYLLTIWQHAADAAP